MTYYYWGQTGQPQFPAGQTQMGQMGQMGQMPMNQFPSGQFQTGQPQTGRGQQFFPPTTSGGFMQNGFNVGAGSAPTLREESYIENILRLNRGKPGTFYFTVPSADLANQQGNTKIVRGVVVEAGRDHAIIRELQTNHTFLFPMIYFDFAEFDEELMYFSQPPGLPSGSR